MNVRDLDQSAESVRQAEKKDRLDTKTAVSDEIQSGTDMCVHLLNYLLAYVCESVHVCVCTHILCE